MCGEMGRTQDHKCGIFLENVVIRPARRAISVVSNICIFGGLKFGSYVMSGNFMETKPYIFPSLDMAIFQFESHFPTKRYIMEFKALMENINSLPNKKIEIGSRFLAYRYI